MSNQPSIDAHPDDDLKVFMRESAKVEEIVSAPGPETILDKDGKPITLKIKVLSQATIQNINDNYKKKTVATDKKGNPYIQNGEVAFRVERDSVRASQHIVAEALAYPDLKNKELMKFFDCHDISEMPLKVFPTAEEYGHVSRMVMAALGVISGPSSEDLEEAVAEAKN
jgi:hypothetical protein